MTTERMPKKYDVVICRITRINPHSVYADLVEYPGLHGMVHVSEVANRWIRDIREFVKEKQFVTCKVMGMDEQGISLSIKRVSREENTQKMNEFKRETKAQRLLEIASKNIGKTLDDAAKEVGDKLIEEFGTLTKTFELASRNPGLLKSKGVPENWAKAITDTADKNRADKTFEVRAEMDIKFFDSDGVEKVRAVLSEIEKKGFGVRYVSAPKYVITGSGKNFKEVRAQVEAVVSEAVKDVPKRGKGQASYKIAE